MKIVFNNNFIHTDLDVYECGIEQCLPKHSFGPVVRDLYFIHYILKGKGSFTTGSKVYNLKAGQGFIIFPNALVHYEADFEDPWNYCWISFHGVMTNYYLKQCGFESSYPILEITDLSLINSFFQNIMASEKRSFGRETYLRGYLYLLLSQHIEEKALDKITRDEDLKDIYIKNAIEFININYSKKITVETIADYLGINSKYLWKLFKSSTGLSTSEFLINTRVERAVNLLKNSSLSVSDIARSVGYEDPLQFSKIFKKIKGLAPRDYSQKYSDENKIV